VLAALVGFLGDFDKAEEAAQEAFVIAAERWQEKGEGEVGGAMELATSTPERRFLTRRLGQL
jgi:RNA polymerase sigma-70 factor (ECF subfamily)